MINNFSKEYVFLSNFYECSITYQDDWYLTAEHLYQALKTTNPEERKTIRESLTPGVAKRAGKTITLRPYWNETKDSYMRLVLYLKFNQCENLRELLLQTGGHLLVEGNSWHDNYWGICACDVCIDRVGRNTLGKILMDTRKELEIAEYESEDY